MITSLIKLSSLYLIASLAYFKYQTPDESFLKKGLGKIDFKKYENITGGELSYTPYQIDYTGIMGAYYQNSLKNKWDFHMFVSCEKNKI